jgi:hypothetical protein
MFSVIQRLLTNQCSESLNCDAEAAFFGEKLLFTWVSIKSIEAYKIDEVTTDLICLDFFLKSGGKVTVHEDLFGFKAFLETLQTTITLNNLDWMHDVMQPPFKENRTQIYVCL